MSNLVVRYNGAPITHGVRASDINIPTRAENGEAGMGGVPIEDPNADLTLLGHRPFTVEEWDCSQPILWMGYTQERGIGREPDKSLIAGTDARIHDTTIVELNAAFNFLQIGETDGKRPAETWKQRLDWIVGSDYLSPFMSDTGYVASAAVLDPFYLARPMDAADFVGQYPSAVLDDLAQRLEGFYFVYFSFWDAAAGKVGLFMNPDTESIGTSPLSISNVLSERNGTTVFEPNRVARLTREPDQVYSGVTVIYSRGTKRLYRSRSSTAATYTKRETEIERPFTGGAETASKQAEAFLDRHSVELDRITCAITVPAASAGLVRAGQHINVKFTHLGDPYDAGTTMRVVECTPTPTDDRAAFYEIALELIALWQSPSGSVTPEATQIELQGCFASRTVDLIWYYTGDNPASGWAPFPKAGPVDYIGGPLAYSGILLSGNGTLDMHHGGEWKCVVGQGISSLSVNIIKTVPGSPYPVFIAGNTWSISRLTSGYQSWTVKTSIDAIGIVCSSGEGLGLNVSWNGPIHMPFYRASPGSDKDHAVLTVTGTLTPVSADTETDLGPTPFATVTSDRAPTVNDDESLGYSVGNRWIDTATGNEWVLMDETDGAAVWVSTTGAAPTNGSNTNGSNVATDFIWRPLTDGFIGGSNSTVSIVTNGGTGEAIMAFGKR